MARTVTRYKNVPPFLRNAQAAAEWGKQHVETGMEDEEGYEEYMLDNGRMYSNFAKHSYEDGKVVLYRAVRVPVVNGKAEVNLDCAGKAWSRIRSGAGVYGSAPAKENHRDVIIQATVRPQDIDWEYGFTSFLYYGESQWEVSMIEDSPILVTHIDGQELPMPVDANTGPAGEIWEQTCGKREQE